MDFNKIMSRLKGAYNEINNISKLNNQYNKLPRSSRITADHGLSNNDGKVVRYWDNGKVSSIGKTLPTNRMIGRPPQAIRKQWLANDLGHSDKHLKEGFESFDNLYSLEDDGNAGRRNALKTQRSLTNISEILFGK